MFAIQINVDRITKLLEKTLKLPEPLSDWRRPGCTAPANTEEVLNRRIRTRITENLEEVGKAPSPPNILEYSGPNGNRVFGLIDKVKIWNVHWYLISEADQSRLWHPPLSLGQFFCAALFAAVRRNPWLWYWSLPAPSPAPCAPHAYQ